MEDGNLFPGVKSTDEKGLADKSSARASTDSDEAMMLGIIEEGASSTKSDQTGTKRKAAIEEEDDDSVYDSSDYESEEEEEEEEDDLLDSSSVPVIGNDGQVISDEEILDWMTPDERSPEEKLKLLPKLKRYLNSIYKSGGFDCTDYPGYVSGVTQFIPRQFVIDQRVRYPEGYHHLMYLGSLALKHYNDQHDAKFSIKAVEKVMISRAKGTIYYLTLTASDGLISKTFQADVWDNTVNIEMEVSFCEPVQSSSVEELPPDNSTEGESKKSTSEEAWSDRRVEEVFDNAVNEKSDLVTLISSLLSRMSDPSMLKSIRNCKCIAGKDEGKLISKVGKYLTSILQSKGFKCTNFPGFIPGITIVTPRQKLIDQRNYFVEGHSHLRLMAKLALDFYLKDNKTELELVVMGVQAANLWRESESCFTYYITFTSLDLIGYEYQQTFEAELQDRQSFIKVISCRPANVM